MNKIIYLDNASSSRIDERVFEEMLPFLKDNYGNPSSIHSLGNVSRSAIDAARQQTADLISASSDEIYFTSSATESNNFALMGICGANKSKGNHIITSVIEHVSITNPLKELSKNGFTVTTLGVDENGFVDPKEVKKAIKPETVLISVMHANNEIGTIQKTEEIGRIAEKRSVLFHCDAAASAGIIPVDVNALKVSSLSFSAQQMHGPKGTAALYVKKGTRIKPFILGGVQEKGRRAGTENVAGIAGLGKACEIAKAEMETNNKKIIKLREKLIKGIKDNVKHVKLNGSPTERLPGNVHFSFEFIEGESIVLFLNMQKIMVATGSSCASQALKVSHVCTSIGLDQATAQGSIMFSISKYNEEKEIEKVIDVLPSIIEKLRIMSPLYKEEL